LMIVFFAVAGQLFSGTVIGCGVGAARALAIIAYFFLASDGGVFNVVLPISEVTVNLRLDISILLLMVAAVNLISVVQNILEAITILNENLTRKSLPPSN